MPYIIKIENNETGESFELRWSDADGYVIEGFDSNLVSIDVPPKIYAALMAAKELL